MARKKVPPLNMAWHPGMISHTELASADPDSSKRFLERVFDWRFLPSDASGYWIFRTPGGVTGGGLRETEPEESPGATVYVEVEDLATAQERVTDEGGRIIVPRVDLGAKGSFFWCQAPGGLVFACFESPKAARRGAKRSARPSSD